MTPIAGTTSWCGWQTPSTDLPAIHYGESVAGSGPTPSSAGVSERMARVARRDTKPEIGLRRELHRRGLRYRVDTTPVSALRGRADVVFRPTRVAVYVDGCFWHSCPQHGVLPKSNREWWQVKLKATVERDRASERVLQEMGWQVLRVWEHEDPVEAADRVEAAVATRRDARECA